MRDLFTIFLHLTDFKKPTFSFLFFPFEQQNLKNMINNSLMVTLSINPPTWARLFGECMLDINLLSRRKLKDIYSYTFNHKPFFSFLIHSSDHMCLIMGSLSYWRGCNPCPLLLIHKCQDEIFYLQQSTNQALVLKTFETSFVFS